MQHINIFGILEKNVNQFLLTFIIPIGIFFEPILLDLPDFQVLLGNVLKKIIFLGT